MVVALAAPTAEVEKGLVAYFGQAKGWRSDRPTARARRESDCWPTPRTRGAISTDGRDRPARRRKHDQRDDHDIEQVT